MTHEYQNCPHGKIGYCEPCSEDAIMGMEAAFDGIKDCQSFNSGLDCDYYDFPENIRSAQDMIEWLDLNFANGNILKSLIREHGATTKETEALYEAEKRYFFAKREYERVSGMPCKETARLRGTHDVKEEEQ